MKVQYKYTGNWIESDNSDSMIQECVDSIKNCPNHKFKDTISKDIVKEILSCGEEMPTYECGDHRYRRYFIRSSEYAKKKEEEIAANLMFWDMDKTAVMIV